MKPKKEEIKKLKKEKIDLMLFLLFCILTLTFTIGYSALNTELKISGEAVYRVQADIRITGVELSEITYNASENYSGKYSKDQVNLGVTLPSLDSSIKYKVTITNIGNVNMKISNQEYTSNNENIIYELSSADGAEIIKCDGNPKYFYITVKYKDGIALPENKSVDMSIEFTFDKIISILAEGKIVYDEDGSIVDDSEDYFFNGNSITKESVESISFSPRLEIGDNAIGSWDASYNKDDSVIAWYTDNDSNGLYEVIIAGNDEVFLPENSSALFYSFTNLKDIEFNYINTNNVTNMFVMFGFCYNLTNLNLNNFGTSLVMNTAGMFAGCTSLTSLDLSSFDTSNVTTMNSMFEGCENLTTLDLSNFNVVNVEDISFMFSSCTNLLNLNLGNFNTKNVKNMEEMFSDCRSLTSLNLNSFDTTSVTNMYFIFNNCHSLLSLDLSSFNTSNVTDMRGMFNNCRSLLSLDLSSFDTSNATDMSYMFYGCSSLTSLDLSSFTNQILESGDAITKTDRMFSSCTSLSELHLEKWDFLCEGGNALDINGIPASATVYISQDQTENFIGFLNPTFTVIGV